MASIQASRMLLPSASSSLSTSHRRETIKATINPLKIRISPLSLPKLSNGGFVNDLALKGDYRIVTTAPTKENESNPRIKTNDSDPVVIAKLYAVMEAVADRVEMHKNIGEQRDNWNKLFLTSINAITLTAATMCGISATTAANGTPLAALKLASTVLYLGAAGMLCVVNKIQPSQLAEEQRNASRLFKQLHNQIHTTLSIGNPTVLDVNEAMEKVLALDRAYPLPLLGAMLDKFPSTVEPAVWWPQRRTKQSMFLGKKVDANGWNNGLEDEMRQIVRVMRKKDEEDYLRLANIAVKVNKIMAISGPLLTGLAGLGSAFVGSNPLAAIIGAVAGALASLVNAMEHGGQVGMVFEMYRSNAGFFKLMEETIESNVNERRENGQVFETKVALQLGRTVSELKRLSASSARNGTEAFQEFASKLF
ncbi:hypothetical protein K2173_004649 [Erythroxylum novogranatense]|uniref:F-box protein n=1 Tax=Erythroxylum novogranatense TaxID=1862640 RepID=A0AAV8T4U9_9ROSI|nr:hypothetical protein K2173_004649 [Erythroxylum novogranatense]